MSKGVWGIDIAKSNIKIVRMELQGEDAVITHFDSIPVSIAEGESSQDALKGALAEFKHKYGGKEPVVFSLPSNTIFIRVKKLPPVEDDKLEEIVRMELKNDLPFDPSQVLWGFHAVPGGAGEERELMLIAVKRGVVEDFLGLIKDLKLDITALQFGQLGLYNFLAYDRGDDLGESVIVLDIGANNTSLLVMDRGRFWVRDLPVTATDFTKAMAKTFNIPINKAEALKVGAAQSQHIEKIYSVLQGVYQELVAEIHRSLGFYKNIVKGAKFSKLVLVGNGSKSFNLARFLSQALSINVSGMQQLKRVHLAENVDATLISQNLLTIGPAVGLGLQGLGLAPTRVNFLPPEYLKEKEKKRKVPIMMGGVALLYIGILLGQMQVSGAADSAGKTGRDLKGTVSQVEAKKKDYETVAKQPAFKCDKCDRLLDTNAQCPCGATSEKLMSVYLCKTCGCAVTSPECDHGGVGEKSVGLEPASYLSVQSYRLEQYRKMAPMRKLVYGIQNAFTDTFSARYVEAKDVDDKRLWLVKLEVKADDKTRVDVGAQDLQIRQFPSLKGFVVELEVAMTMYKPCPDVSKIPDSKTLRGEGDGKQMITEIVDSIGKSLEAAGIVKDGTPDFLQTRKQADLVVSSFSTASKGDEVFYVFPAKVHFSIKEK